METKEEFSPAQPVGPVEGVKAEEEVIPAEIKEENQPGPSAPAENASDRALLISSLPPGGIVLEGLSLRKDGSQYTFVDTNRAGHCQIPGCTRPSEVAYHKRYRICRYHCELKWILVGDECLRFCQQCGRFHNIEEFDGERRSCREKLARHNLSRKRARAKERMLEKMAIAAELTEQRAKRGARTDSSSEDAKNQRVTVHEQPVQRIVRHAPVRIIQYNNGDGNMLEEQQQQDPYLHHQPNSAELTAPRPAMSMPSSSNNSEQLIFNIKAALEAILPYMAAVPVLNSLHGLDPALLGHVPYHPAQPAADPPNGNSSEAAADNESLESRLSEALLSLLYGHAAPAPHNNDQGPSDDGGGQQP